MPVTLLHGPAGSSKTDVIIRRIAQRHFLKNQTPYLAVLPHADAAGWFQRRLLAELPQAQTLSTAPILALDEFLFKFLKINLPRLHGAPPSLSRNLIRVLLEKKSHSAMEKMKDYPAVVTSLLRTFLLLKKAGLSSSDECRALLKNHYSSVTRAVLSLFDDYQTRLHELYYADAGDLVSMPLVILKEGRDLAVPDGWEAVYFDRIFPMSLGMREILMRFGQRFPEKNWMVSYSFDYRQEEDPFFYPAYNFLGEIAQESEYIHLDKEEQPYHSLSFSDPETECFWIASDIHRKIQSGVRLDTLGIVVGSQSFYHRRLTELLEKDGIPVHNPYQPPLSRFSSPIAEAVSLFRETKAPSLRDSLIAGHGMDEFEKNFSFERELVSDRFIPEEKWLRWKNEELVFERLARPSQAYGVKLGSLVELHPFNFTTVYIAGYTASQYPSSSSEYPLLEREAYLSPYLREILQGPVYRMHLEKMQLWHLICRSEGEIYFTHPLLHWDGKEQTPSGLIEGLKLEYFRPVPPSDGGSTVRPSLCFPKLRHTSFNVTELETYLQCPYQYYARHYLKLGKLPYDGPDIAPDIKGIFAHRILERFYAKYTENQPFLFKEAGAQGIQNTVRTLVEDERKSSLLFHGIAYHLVDYFCDRVVATVASLVTEEISWIKDGKKQTQAAYMEWAFGRGRIPALSMRTGDFKVFVSGRIDRIDINAEKKIFSVIDYKTGELPSGKKIREAGSLQLPLYLLAVKTHLFKRWAPASALFIGLKDIRDRTGLAFEGQGEEELASRSRITMEEFAALEEAIEGKIGEVTQRIFDGDFKPDPADKGMCQFCDFRRICHGPNASATTSR